MLVKSSPNSSCVRPEREFPPEAYAAIYARRSSTKENNSLPFQVSEASEVLKREGLILYNIYEEAVSATKVSFNERKAFRKLLADVRAGEFKTLIVFKRDRLARKADEFMAIKRIFKKHNIKILYSDPNEFQLSDDLTGDFIENVMVAVNELEPAIIAERSAAGIRKKREMGEYSSGRSIPYGLEKKKNESGCTVYLPDEDNAGIIHWVFKKYQNLNDKYTLKDLCDQLNYGKGLKEKITPQKVINIITNPIYAGMQLKDSKVKVKDIVTINKLTGQLQVEKEAFQKCSNVKQLVSEEVWYKALQRWAENNSNSNSRGDNYPFRGLLLCGNCQTKIRPEGQVYRCSSTRCFNVKSDIVVETVLKKIVDECTTDSIAKSTIQSKVKNLQVMINENIKSIANLEQQKERTLLEYINSGRNPDIKKEYMALVEKQNNLKDEKSHYESQKFEICGYVEELNKAINSNAKNIMVSFLKSNLSTTQALIEELVEKVVLRVKRYECEVRNVSYQG